MLTRFEEMPMILKFLTAHALVCALLLVVSIIPMTSYNIGGQQVDYAEWWNSGVGIMASFVGVAMPISGLMFLKKSKYARGFYISSLSIVIIWNGLIFKTIGMLLGNGVLVLAIGLYLYSKAP